MELALYQSERGDMVIVPACLAPTLEAIHELGMLFPRGHFEVGDDASIIDFEALMQSGYARVDPGQLALLRASAPPPVDLAPQTDPAPQIG